MNFMQHEKHGNYSKFDLKKARWDCALCGKDTMKVSTDRFSSRAWFVCPSCGFDSRTIGTFSKDGMRFNDSVSELICMLFIFPDTCERINKEIREMRRNG